MHLLLLAWDVDEPGHLAPSLLGLARALTDHGATCEVVTLGTGPTSTRTVEGIPVTWVAEAPPVLPAAPAYDLSRVLAAASRASAAAERRCQVTTPDVVLACGWHTTWTATTLRTTRGTPIVAVLDSTAALRDVGELDDAGRLVAQVEWWLTYEARRVVAPDTTVARALRRAYRLPPDSLDVVPRGVTVPDGTGLAGDAVAVLGPSEVVRHARACLPRTVRLHTDVSDRAPVPGVVVVLDDDRHDDVLTAMAAGAAVVVPEDGPLRGLVHLNRTGLRTGRRGHAVAGVLVDLLDRPARRRRLGDRARHRAVEEHAWPVVADRLLAVARAAVTEEAALVGSSIDDRALRPILLRSPLVAAGDDERTRTNARHGPKGHG